MKGTLFLIPTAISNDNPTEALPIDFVEIVNELDAFIVENIKTTRRFLRSVGYTKDFDQIPYHLLNKHSDSYEMAEALKSLQNGKKVGLLSEAGMPCVADPGAAIVRQAHASDIKVKPVSGPSSIIMALSASGFNGQNFAFNGYLPIEAGKRKDKIKKLEQRIYQEEQTQLFIEAPYRNNALLDALIHVCHPETWLCVASEVTSADEFIQSKPMKAWKKSKPNLHKKNTVFLLYK